MKTEYRASKIVLGWVMLAILFVGLPSAVSAATNQEPPAGISLGEWQKMRAQIRKAQYHFTADDAADTGLCPKLSRDRQSVEFEDSVGQTVLNYDKLSVSDAEGNPTSTNNLLFSIKIRYLQEIIHLFTSLRLFCRDKIFNFMVFNGLCLTPKAS